MNHKQSDHKTTDAYISNVDPLFTTCTYAYNSFANPMLNG